MPGEPAASDAVYAPEPTPRLTVIGPTVTYPLAFGSISTGGDHVLFEALKHPETDATDTASVWDAIAQRYVRRTFGHYQMASADGGTVAVATTDTLLPEDTDNQSDVYVTSPTGLRLASKGTSEPALDAVFVSNDGGLVVFRTREAVTPDDLDSGWDYYGWSAAADQVTLMTRDLVLPAFKEGTTDGAHVFFTDGSFGLWDWSAGVTTHVVATAGSQVSADGTRIYLTTNEALVPEDLDLESDVYSLVGGDYTLLTPDTTAYVSLDRISADGTRWLVSTTEPLTSDDIDTEVDLYLYWSGGIAHIEPGPFGGLTVGAADDLSAVVIRTGTGINATDVDGTDDLYRWSLDDPEHMTLLTGPTQTSRPALEAISPDGRRIIIQTQERLLPEDVDEGGQIYDDVYEWHDGVLTLLSVGDERQAQFLGASDDATRVVFDAISPLVPEDTDASQDIYVSDRDVESPVATIAGPTGGHSGTTATVHLGSAASDAIWFDCRLDGEPWDQCQAATTFASLAAGSHTVDVVAFDAAANRSAVASATWTVAIDTTPPKATAPTSRLRASTNLSSGRITTRIAWTGSDVGSGIARYELAQRTDSGAWTTVSTTLTAPMLDRALSSGHTYAFRVRAVDSANLTGAWATGPLFKLTSYSELSAGAKYTGAWASYTSTAYWGGKARSATTAGARTALTFTGRSVAIVSRLGPGRGKAEIWIGSTKMATIDLGSASYSNQRVIWSGAWTTSIKRTVTIKVLGTSGRPRIEVDGFITGS